MKPKSNRLNRNAAVSLAYLFFFFASNCNVLDVNFAGNREILNGRLGVR